MNKKKIIVGLSGGVDSSVAALLLQQQGYHVEGLFMKNWEEEGDTNCTASQDLIDVQMVCAQLGIRLHTVNFANEYWDRVFSYFLAEYKAGRTPNPDVMCNKEIKFKAFLDYALTLDADYIATGHYAGINIVGTGRDLSASNKSNTDRSRPVPTYQLIKAADLNKDQTYFLYTLNQQQLSKTLFPLASLSKPEVRAIAKQNNFVNHAKKDSTGICFIGERKFKTFLSKYLPAKPGNIETDNGKVIGQHDGLMYYTIGQRQGIGIGGRNDAKEEPWYVIKKDLARNVLIVGQGHDHPLLFTNQLIANQLHWVSGNSPEIKNCHAKIRYRQADQACCIEKIDHEMATVSFTTPQRAVTPGQSIVFYDEDICLGGGVIING